MVKLIWRCIVIYTLGMIAVGFAIGVHLAQPGSADRPFPAMAQPGNEPDEPADIVRRV
jgi:hypothetical protein